MIEWSNVSEQTSIAGGLCSFQTKVPVLCPGFVWKYHKGGELSLKNSVAASNLADRVIPNIMGE